MKTTNPLSWHLVGRNEQCSGGRKWMKQALNRAERRASKQVALDTSKDIFAHTAQSSCLLTTIQWMRKGDTHSIPFTFKSNNYVCQEVFMEGHEFRDPDAVYRMADGTIGKTEQARLAAKALGWDVNDVPAKVWSCPNCYTDHYEGLSWGCDSQVCDCGYEPEPEHTSCSLLTPLPYEVARQAIWNGDIAND